MSVCLGVAVAVGEAEGVSAGVVLGSLVGAGVPAAAPVESALAGVLWPPPDDGGVEGAVTVTLALRAADTLPAASLAQAYSVLLPPLENV